MIESRDLTLNRAFTFYIHTYIQPDIATRTTTNQVAVAAFPINAFRVPFFLRLRNIIQVSTAVGVTHQRVIQQL